MVHEELDEEDLDEDAEDEIEDVIADMEEECAAVFDNEDNARLLGEIFETARANFEKDKKGWKGFMADLKFELISTDDEDNIGDILAHYLRKAKLELS